MQQHGNSQAMGETGRQSVLTESSVTVRTGSQLLGVGGAEGSGGQGGSGWAEW